MSWAPTLDRLEEATNPEKLRDVHVLLRQLVEAYGNNRIAALLAVDPSMVSRWNNFDQQAPISSIMSSRILAIYDVLVRAHQIFTSANAARWLFGSEPLLGGARPIDVLVLRGATPVVEVLDSIEDGAYA